MKILCEPAKQEDINELRTLWKLSFNDTDEFISLFFDQYFKPYDCIVSRADGRIAAMAHLLPSSVVSGEGTLRCHYLYAAATLPELRGRGIMGYLLQYAAEYGQKRGDKYSVLVPAGESLFSYYRKHGYETLSYHERVTFTREECVSRVCNISSVICPEREIDYTAVLEARNSFISTRPGSLIWDIPALKRAEAISGARILQPDKTCYAFVRLVEPDILEVIECIADEKGFDKILLEMLKSYFKMSIFRLPPLHGLFGVSGTLSEFAMYRPLGGCPAIHEPLSYVGLPLD